MKVSQQIDNALNDFTKSGRKATKINLGMDLFSDLVEEFKDQMQDAPEGFNSDESCEYKGILISTSSNIGLLSVE